MHHEMDQAHMDLMAGMNETNNQMMASMMVEDIDVAFVCSMIPHHQGAINMAKAELAHGDNQWAKDMADGSRRPGLCFAARHAGRGCGSAFACHWGRCRSRGIARPRPW
ncbi:DUF305 domain-containing protein [Devosia marina]|uniref:DUF305 domain-containing protein n=1 Tax=Devosia marina TaxID=2683198 RepID=A0A7X3K424_9HYPH|nr:DUF305 domain-containing protein [Devosia marina]MVT00148.1 DUF305 domain-containing protein [Devosia marina]